MAYPLEFEVDYPDRELNRVTTFFRVLWAIPIVIVLALVNHGLGSTVGLVGGLLFLPPLLLIVFREKYPRWWFDWNLALLCFANRIASYLCLLGDEYPSTDEDQNVHLEMTYPEVKTQLNRWLPLVKWFLAIPHYVALFGLNIALLVVVVISWFAIIFTGRYPRWAFDFVVGVLRWNNRVVSYAFVLITDQYPPFQLTA